MSSNDLPGVACRDWHAHSAHYYALRVDDHDDVVVSCPGRDRDSWPNTGIDAVPVSAPDLVTLPAALLDELLASGEMLCGSARRLKSYTAARSAIIAYRNASSSADLGVSL